MKFFKLWGMNDLELKESKEPLANKSTLRHMQPKQNRLKGAW